MPLRPHLGLRSRIAIGFAIVAVTVAGALATLAYQRTRAVLVGDRQDAAVVQTFVNARLVRDALRDPTSDVAELLASLSTASRSEPLLRQGDQWFGRSVTVDVDDIPAPLRRRVSGGTASRQRFVVDDRPLLGVGVPIPSIGGEYFEVFPLEDLERTLQTLSAALWTGAGVAGIGVAGIGLLATRRVLRPLASATSAARQIAAGDLATRIDAPADRELEPLVDAFNDMATSLSARVDRDRRFASVVSHELRSPLTSLRTAMDVAVTRLPPLDERAQVVVDLVRGQLDRFERMTLDLLEISRIDAGVAPLDNRPVEIGPVVREMVDVSTNGRVPTAVVDEVTVDVDVARLEWSLANLLANTSHHAGGATGVVVDATDDTVRISVDDAGPGVPEADRERIFERFARGSASHGTPGAGLGLSLVREHVRVMGGTVTIGDSPTGGARFTIELPR
ncbi:MAG TPA: ATP-binding protein [Acidimicrobiales bacterium]|nr:ATP-binding protein [Acidimicrobiales bacterium]